MLALALPFLSLSFGYNPSKAELDEAAELIEAHAESFTGWEVSSILWAAARLGYRPSPTVTDSLLQQVGTWSLQVQARMRFALCASACWLLILENFVRLHDFAPVC